MSPASHSLETSEYSFYYSIKIMGEESNYESLLVIGADGTLQACSSSFEQLLGYDKGELIGNPVSQLYPDESFSHDTLPKLAQELYGSGSTEGKTFIQHKEGMNVPIHFKASLLKDDQDKVSAIVVFIRDLQGQRKQELDLESLARFPDENPSPVLRVSRDCRLLYANRGSQRLLKIWKVKTGLKLPASLCSRIETAFTSRRAEEFELKLGQRIYAFNVQPIGTMNYANVYGRDITERKLAQDKLLLDAQVFQNASEGIMITDKRPRIVDVNDAFCTITGYSRAEVVGKNPSILQSGKHEAAFYQDLWRTLIQTGSWQGEVWDRRNNGEVYPKWVSMSSVKNTAGQITHFIGIFSDLTTKKQTEEYVYYVSHFDSLTGLANRHAFMDRLAQSLIQARRMQSLAAILFLDLDGFKLINDSLGHRAGDQLLRLVAERLKGCIRDSDNIARMGSDEFAILLGNFSKVDDVGGIVEKILHSYAEPFLLENQEVFVTSTIGISVFPLDADEPEILLVNANAAMNQAKEQGKNIYQFYSKEMNERTLHRLVMTTQLRRSIDAQELMLHFQPQVDLQTDKIVGVEALVRWNSAEMGLISPGEFIPLAEETGLIDLVGEWVLSRACEQGRLWQQEGLPPVKICVNLSVRQLQGHDIVSTITRIVSESRFDATLLELELTESMLADRADQMIDKLHKLKSLGVTLAIDDFGTGYSSMSYLKKFPIDRLKIDRSFIKDLPGNVSDAEITTAIVAMGNSLGLNVIAEGVETQEQYDFLKEKGCHQVQGYLCSPPVPPEDIPRLLINLDWRQPIDPTVDLPVIRDSLD